MPPFLSRALTNSFFDICNKLNMYKVKVFGIESAVCIGWRRKLCLICNLNHSISYSPQMQLGRWGNHGNE